MDRINLIGNFIMTVAVIIAIRWEIIDRRKHLTELQQAINKYNRSNQKLELRIAEYSRVKKIERWNIRLLRQEVIDLVKAKGGKL